jgi:hypothetical protein
MVKIIDYLMNSPEGYCSVVSEYMNNSSLQNLIDTAGSLPETVLRNITSQLVKSLETFSKKSESSFGGICPSNVLFNNKGTLRLANNFKKILSENDEYQRKYLSNLSKKEKNNTQKFNNILMKNILVKERQKLQNNNNNNNKIFDQFDLGFLVLQSAIGNIDIIDFSEFQCEHKTAENKRDCCCLFHCVQKFEESLKTKYKITSFINLKNFSEEFIHFLCVTTSYENHQYPFAKLKFHPFIKNIGENKKINSTVIQFKNKNKISEKYLISLKELLVISSEPSGKFEYINNAKPNSKFDKFSESISMVMPNCENYFKEMKIRDFDQLFNKNSDLKDLLQELEVDQESLQTRLRPIFEQVLTG